ncbi:MAG: hypothetical protein AB7Q37_18905 [Pyrinomonadaceae bacterium]
MPRKKYQRSDETYDVLKHHVGAIAKEYPSDASYIYAIKNGDSNDPYPHFRHLFLAAARAGAPVKIWLRDLSAIAARAECSNEGAATDLVTRLSEKIESDAHSTSELLAAITDRVLDKAECHRILSTLEASRKIENDIATIVEVRLAELSSGKLQAA